MQQVVPTLRITNYARSKAFYVDAWYAEFQSKGVPVKEPPNESLQGLRDMTVVDPDGNKLRICTRLKGWTRK